jgi:hypothetical protein
MVQVLYDLGGRAYAYRWWKHYLKYYPHVERRRFDRYIRHLLNMGQVTGPEPITEDTTASWGDQATHLYYFIGPKAPEKTIILQAI